MNTEDQGQRGPAKPLPGRRWTPRAAALGHARRLAGWIVARAAMQPSCTRTVAAEFSTASTLPDKDPRPDGIAIDLSSEPPAARDQATVREEIVTLRAPWAIA